MANSDNDLFYSTSSHASDLQLNHIQLNLSFGHFGENKYYIWLYRIFF